MKIKGKYLFIVFILTAFLFSCESEGGGNNNYGQNNYSAPVRTSSLLGKVFKIFDVIDIANQVFNLISNETQDCNCRYDYAYLVATSDRKKGIDIYFDGEYVGEASSKQAFLKIVNPGYHTIVAKDHRRNRKWQKSVSINEGGIQIVSFNREDWERED